MLDSAKQFLTIGIIWSVGSAAVGNFGLWLTGIALVGFYFGAASKVS